MKAGRVRRFAIAMLPLCLAALAATAGEQTLAAPSITPTGGAYSLNAVVRVAIRSEPGTVVIYTLDDTSPEWNRGIRCDSNLASFDLPPGDVEVRAAAFRPGLPRSSVRVARFTRTGQ